MKLLVIFGLFLAGSACAYEQAIPNRLEVTHIDNLESLARRYVDWTIRRNQAAHKSDPVEFDRANTVMEKLKHQIAKELQKTVVRSQIFRFGDWVVFINPLQYKPFINIFVYTEANDYCEEP